MAKSSFTSTFENLGTMFCHFIAKTKFTESFSTLTRADPAQVFLNQMWLLRSAQHVLVFAAFCLSLCKTDQKKKMEQESKVPSLTTEGDRRAPSLCAAYMDMALESSAEVCSMLSTVQGKSLPRMVRTNGMSVTQPTSFSLSYLTALQFPNADN